MTGGCDKERADDDELEGVERWRGRGLDGEDAERCGGGTRAEWMTVEGGIDERFHVPRMGVSLALPRDTL